MKSNKSNKARKLAIKGTLMATMLLSPVVAFAQTAPTTTSNQHVSSVLHDVSITGSSLNTSLVKPDQSFTLDVSVINPVRQQLENQSFGVLLVSNSGDKIFLDAGKGDVSYDGNGVIAIKSHPLFTRYTSYSASILIKSDYQQALLGNYPTSVPNTDSLSFKVGSAIGEATKVSAEVESNSVRVTSIGNLDVKTTDDYNDPATNATLTLTGSGNGNARVASDFSAQKTTQITDGQAVVPLTDHSAEVANLSYTVHDNTYGSAVDSNSGTVEETFLPGTTSQIHVQAPQKVVVGSSGTISGDAVDVYGNSVEDGTPINVSASHGSTDSSVVTANGNFSFNYTAPTKKGSDSLSVVASDSQQSINVPVYDRAGSPATIVADGTVTAVAGQATQLTFDVLDSYGNLVEDGEPLTLSFSNGAMSPQSAQTVDGKVTFNFTPSSAGSYGYSINAGNGGFTYTASAPLQVSSGTATLPTELQKVVDSGKQVLVVDPSGITSTDGSTVSSTGTASASDALSQAIQMAKPGDGIYLMPGTYNADSGQTLWVAPYKKYSAMTLHKSLTIVGDNPSDTTLLIDDSNSAFHTDGQQFAVTFDAPNITLKNLTIKVNEDKVQSLWSIFNFWGIWDGSTSRGSSIENVNVDVNSPVPYLFYMNDYDMTAKNLTVKSNGNIKNMFYWNYGSIQFEDSSFDMPRPAGVTATNTTFSN